MKKAVKKQTMRKLTLTLLFAILLISNLTTATIIPLEPCGATTSNTNGRDLTIENNCIRATLSDNYNPNVDFYDKIHEENFQLHLDGLEERELISPFRTRNVQFASLGLTGSIQGNKLVYTNGDITIGYILQGRTLKAYAEINNFAYQYANSELWVETKYKNDARGKISHLAPEIDNVRQPIQTTTRSAGQNFFYQQRLGRGNQIILDPIFTVDYTPTPAVLLINGSPTGTDTAFATSIDVTTNLSDNNTATIATIQDNNWYDNSWLKRKQINITNSGSTTLTNFPVLINITKTPDMQSDFDDLRFIKGACQITTSTTPLNYEIENYTSTNALLWLQIPSFTTGTNQVCLYYNNTGATNAQNITGTWETNYAGVWHFPEIGTGTTRLDSTSNNNDATPNNYNGDEGATIIDGAEDLDGTNDFLTTTSNELQTSNSITMEAIINADDTSGREIITYTGYTGGNGWGETFATQHEMHLAIDTNTISCFYGNAETAGSIDITSAFTDTTNSHHLACVITSPSASPSATLYLDGVSVGTDTGTQTGRANWNIPLRFGAPSASERFFNGIIDEIRTSTNERSSDWINQTYQIMLNNSNRVTFSTEETQQQPNQLLALSWSNTFNATYNWFLRINKESGESGDAVVYAYQDNNTINTSQNVTQNLIGQGFFNINITNLLQYEDSISLGFAKLRLLSQERINVSEVWLRQELNDTIPPSVTNCTLPQNSFSCSDATAHLHCDVTDDTDVLNVTYQVDGANYTTIQESGHFGLNYNLPNSNGTRSFNWTNVYAYDILGNLNETTVNLQFNQTCIYEDYINIQHNQTTQLTTTETTATIDWTTSNLSNSTVNYGLNSTNLNETKNNPTLQLNHSIDLIGLTSNTTYYYEITSAVNPNQTIGTFNFTTTATCTENWIEDTITCSLFDNYTRTYTDTNACGTTNNLPFDNGTTQTCNYCSQDLQITTGICLANETQTINYTDNNYLTCCQVTGIGSDCQIETSPFNETSSQSCTFYTQEFNCTIDPEPVIKKKINLQCNLPTNMSESECVVNVKQQQNQTFPLLATTPEFKKANEFLFFPTESEERTSFTTTNRILNAYYTDKELRPNTNYMIEVVCADNSTTVKYQQLVTPEYHVPDTAINRLVWLGQRPFFIITTLILFLLILGGVIWLVRKVKRET